MPGVRDHEPFVIEDFSGWWQRGDSESAPSDHFIQADNIQYFNSGFEVRLGVRAWQTALTLPAQQPLKNIKRIYPYTLPSGIWSMLVLTDGGKLYHMTSNGNLTTPILTIDTPEVMEDFGFVNIGGRAYITPFKSYLGGLYQLGLKNEYVYVYKGDGTPARRAGYARPVDNPGRTMTGDTIPASNPGHIGDANYNPPPAPTVAPAPPVTDPGFHLIGIVYETDTGYLTSIGPLNYVHIHFDPDGRRYIRMRDIPWAPNSTNPALGDPTVVKRHFVSTKAIPTEDFTGNQNDYQYFFIPAVLVNPTSHPNNGGTIPNNDPSVVKWDFAFFDSDLVDDASHLMDNFEHIPAGVNLNTYHSRMVVVGEYGTDTGTDITIEPPDTDNRSVARVSFPGEPEAISKVDGLLIAPRDGNPLTNVQEFRDVLYLFTKTRTFAYSDNFDVPASWQEEVVDQGHGAPVHGVTTVLDSGGVNIDYLLIANLSGLLLFNGTYAFPELSWKIADIWKLYNPLQFNNIQVVNDSIQRRIWIIDPPLSSILYADYDEGLDAKNIAWASWNFHASMSTIAWSTLHNTLFLGAVTGTPDNSGVYILDWYDPGRRWDTYYNRSGGIYTATLTTSIPATVKTAYLGE